MESIGIKKGVEVPEEISAMFDDAMVVFKELSDPKGYYKTISRDEFLEIYSGAGMNESDTPIDQIFNKSDNLAVFVCTLGDIVSTKIKVLLREKDYTMGYMLDKIASESAENAAGLAEIDFAQYSKTEKALLYSPGYCGWHITAQQKIFNFLKPESIGVTLSPSSLMSPVKSVSGILISGEKDIHRFKNNYSFCKTCIGFSCRSRIRSL